MCDLKLITQLYNTLISTCDINLLSKLSIIFKEWRVMNNVDRGGAYFYGMESYCSLCTLDTIVIFCIGECPSNSPFLKNNGAEAHCF
jgi:hypothetical protein